MNFVSDHKNQKYFAYTYRVAIGYRYNKIVITIGYNFVIIYNYFAIL